MKKVMFAIYNLYPGGAERVIAILANTFCKQGYEVSIVILDDKWIRNFSLNNDINIYQNFKKLPQSKKLRIPKQVSYAKKCIKEENPDIIISFMTEVNLIMSLANFFSNAKLIVSERNDPKNDPSNVMIRDFRDFIYQKTNLIDGFVFQTKDAANYFSKKIENKSTIILNPIPNSLPKIFYGDRAKKIVNVGRLAPQKNQKMLIEAFAALPKRFNEYVLEIYGVGELEEDLKELCKTFNILDRVFFKGTTPDVINCIKNASLFVLSSDYEGISNAMLESLAMGIPTISTDCPIGGAKEIIKDGINGLLTEVNDSVQLKNKIISVLDNSNFAQELSKNAIGIRNILSEEKIVKEWIQFSEVILKGNKT